MYLLNSNNWLNTIRKSQLGLPTLDAPWIMSCESKRNRKYYRKKG